MSAALTAEQQGRQRNSLETAERINTASRTKLSCSGLITDGAGLQSCDQDPVSQGSRGEFWGWTFGSGQFWGLREEWGWICVGSGPSLCPGNTWAFLMLPPSPVLVFLGCDTFAFWPSVRAPVGLETLKMATSFSWGISFGFLGDQRSGDLGKIVSQVLCEQSTLSYEQRCCHGDVQGSRRLCRFSPPRIRDNLDFPDGNRFPRGWEGRCRFK